MDSDGVDEGVRFRVTMARHHARLHVMAGGRDVPVQMSLEQCREVSLALLAASLRLASDEDAPQDGEVTAETILTVAEAGVGIQHGSGRPVLTLVLAGGAQLTFLLDAELGAGIAQALKDPSDFVRADEGG